MRGQRQLVSGRGSTKLCRSSGKRQGSALGATFLLCSVRKRSRWPPLVRACEEVRGGGPTASKVVRPSERDTQHSDFLPLHLKPFKRHRARYAIARVTVHADLQSPSRWLWSIALIVWCSLKLCFLLIKLSTLQCCAVLCCVYIYKVP